MKAKYYSYILFFLSLKCLSQQTLNPDLITFPVSPEAARLGTYGNTPVNMFYGQLDKTVELFTGQAGEMNFPVNLNYNYAGFRLEETPSIVGLGWQLSVGGVITREVRSVPDEHPRGYYAGGQYIIGAYFNNGSINFNQIQDLIKGKFDSEADLYHVSVNGINFSFKIGLNGTPVFLNKHDYKLDVERNPTKYHEIISFTLTDTNGNKYYFTEREFTQRVIGSDAVFDDDFPKYVTSWQLSRILANTGEQITFNYQNDNFDSYSYFANGYLFYRTKGAGETPQNIYEIPEAGYTESSAKDLIERKLLSSIISDTFKIYFTISTLNSQDVYSQIIVRDQRNTAVKTYALSYSGVRNTLSKITLNNEFYYEFQYYGSNYPGFNNSATLFPRNQDYWGFANGKQNTHYVDIPFSSYNANRNPDYGSTVQGALSTIKYPTGGYTSITYELNTVAEDPLTTEDAKFNSKIDIEFKTDYPSALSNSKEYTFTKTFTTDVIATLSHSIEVTPHSDLEVTIQTVGGCSTQNYYNALPNLRSLTGEPIPKSCIKLYELFNDGGCSSGTCIYNKDSGGRFIIPAGTYEFKFKTLKNNYYAKCKMQLQYYRADIALSMVNRNTGGIRVKQIVDYPVNSPEVTRMYDYNDNEGLSTAKKFSEVVNVVKYRHALFDEALYRATTGTENGVPFPGTISITVPGYDNYYEYLSRPYNLLLQRGIPVYYTSVKEYTSKETVFTLGKLICDGCSSSDISKGSFLYTYMGDPYIGGGKYGTIDTRYINGYKQTDFDGTAVLQKEYPYAPTGSDKDIGRTKRKATYEHGNSTFIHKELISEDLSYLNFSYDDELMVKANVNYPKSLKLGYKIRGDHDIHSFNFVRINLTIPNSYHLVTYKEWDFSKKLAQKKKLESFGNNTIENTELIGYNTRRDVKQVRTSDSNGLELSSEIYYPYDFSDAVSQAMVTKNILSPTVKMVNKRNSEVTGTTQFNYANITGDIYRPVSFLNSRGSNTLQEQKKYKYDTNGNVTLIYDHIPGVSDPENNAAVSKTVIVYGYKNSLPIAKIENAPFSVLPANIALDLATKSDADNDRCTTATCKEEILRQALNGLRTSYPNALITSYTYDPLIGITSITNPNGTKITYEYDSRSRLIAVRDNEGNLLSENEYNFKAQ